MLNSDENWMHYALQLAQRAALQGEVPVGAVLVQDDNILGEGWNQPISLNDPSAHAEMLAMRAAGQTAANYRLPNTTLYVTLEPCSMCAGALIQSRIKKVYIGTMDYKTGACGSVLNLLEDYTFNHKVECETGILKEECEKILQDFFKKLRKKKK